MVANSTQQSHPSLNVRVADAGDIRRLFRWRNRPDIVVRGFTQRCVTWPEHQAWFFRSLTGDVRQIYIISIGGVAAGQVRFDRLNGSSCEISAFLLPRFSGHGHGIPAIRSACRDISSRWSWMRTVVARIRRDNPRAIVAFQKAGFHTPRQHLSRGGAVEMVLRILALIPHNRLTCGEAEARAVASVARSGRWACGTEVAKLEDDLSRLANVAHAVCVGSGIGALRLSLLALGVTTGDEVVVPAYSCVALPNAVLSLGARPVPADVLPGEWNIDPVDAKKKINRRTKALIAVHTFGCPARIRELKELGVVVVEDCAHALGRVPDETVFGSEGDVAITSFYATKLVGAGEGGAVFSNDGSVVAKVRQWRDYADQQSCATRLNDKMTDIEASLGRCQLDRLPEMLRARAVRARRYTVAFRRFADNGRLELPANFNNRVWYRYVVRVPGVAAKEFCAALAARRIVAAEPVFDWRGEHRGGQMVASVAFRGLVSLPLYPTLTRAEQQRVIGAVADCLQHEVRG